MDFFCGDEKHGQPFIKSHPKRIIFQKMFLTSSLYPTTDIYSNAVELQEDNMMPRKDEQLTLLAWAAKREPKLLVDSTKT